MQLFEPLPGTTRIIGIRIQDQFVIINIVQEGGHLHDEEIGAFSLRYFNSKPRNPVDVPPVVASGIDGEGLLNKIALSASGSGLCS